MEEGDAEEDIDAISVLRLMAGIANQTTSLSAPIAKKMRLLSGIQQASRKVQFVLAD